MPLSTAVKSSFKFLVPFLAWIFLYRNFFLGRHYVSEDTFGIYALIKYFFSSIRLGAIPHWDPYMHWGMANVMQTGELNPLWLLTLVFNAFGLDFYQSFLWTATVYLFAAALGFYCLLRRLFAEEFLSYLGFLLFLFSGVGMTIFTQLTLVLVFVPAVWCMCFLADFYQTRRISSALGIGGALSLAAVTYIPFYFATLLMCLAVAAVFIYPHVLKGIAGHIWFFSRRHIKVFLWIFVGLAIACCVALINWLFLNREFIVLARPQVLDYTFAKDSGLPISEIIRDTSLFHFLIVLIQGHLLSFTREIFSLNNVPPGEQRIFYIPVMAHLLLWFGVFVRLNRRSIFWGTSCFLLFLIAVTSLTVVYEILFKHVPFFKMFRNMFFLTPFLIGLYILLVLEQLRRLWFEQQSKFYAAWVLLAGVIFLKFWHQPGYLPTGTLITAAALIVVFAFRFLGMLGPSNKIGQAALVLLAVLGPVQVHNFYSGQFQKVRQSTGVTQGVKVPLASPQFSYTRPQTGVDASASASDLYDLYHWHIIAMTDASVSQAFKYGYPTRLSESLSDFAASDTAFQEYIRHKFVLYDTGDPMREFSSVDEFLGWFRRQPAGTYVESAAQGLNVRQFGPNRISLSTDFSSAKFLVYNDSYHSAWKASIDGRPVAVARSNFAFKGLWVPAGRHDVRFEFRPVGGWLYWPAAAFFYVYCIFAIVLRIKKI